MCLLPKELVPKEPRQAKSERGHAQIPSTKSPTLLSLISLFLLCPRQTPYAQRPPLLRCSTRPAPRTLTKARTSRRSSDAGSSTHTQVGNAPVFDGGKAGGHRRADSSRIARILPLFKTVTVALARNLRAMTQQRKASSLLHRRTGRSPRVKVRRRNPDVTSVARLCCSSGALPPDGAGLGYHDLGGWLDNHAEKDLAESQKGTGQVAPASRCPLEQELLGRHPQAHGKGTAPVLCNNRTTRKVACRRSAGALPSADAP